MPLRRWPEVTRSQPCCVAIACPNAPRISGPTWHDGLRSVMPGLPFRHFADVSVPARHGGKDTANAVGCNHPPGFKSPILRSSQALSRNLPGTGLTHEGAQGCNPGYSCAHPWPHLPMKQMSWPGTSFAPPHGLVICGPGCAPRWCLGWGIAQPLPPPAVRIATRTWKEIERLTRSNVGCRLRREAGCET